MEPLLPKLDEIFAPLNVILLLKYIPNESTFEQQQIEECCNAIP